MHPVLFDFGTVELFGLSVRLAVGSYGLMFGLALVAGWLVTLYMGRRIDPKAPWTDLYFLTALTGYVGAKVLNVVVNVPAILDGRLTLWGAVRGGGVWLGGCIAGFSLWCWMVRRAGLDIGVVINTYFTALPLTHTIGRIGCFLGGCCYGAACTRPWAVVYTDPRAAELNGTPLNVGLHPTVLYEAALEAGNFLLMFWLWHRWDRGTRHRWLLFALWLGLYGTQRLVLELFRADFRGSVGGLSTSQWISLGMIAVGVTLWVRRGHRPAAAARES